MTQDTELKNQIKSILLELMETDADVRKAVKTTANGTNAENAKMLRSEIMSFLMKETSQQTSRK